MELPDWLTHRALTHPGRLAVAFGPGEGPRWSYEELHRRASRTARRLAGLGVRPGERVAVLLPNGPALVELVHAVARLGAVLVPLNTRLAAPELGWQLADGGVRLLVCDASTERLAGAARREANMAGGGAAGWRVIVAEALEDLPEADGVCLRERIALDEPHTVVYTSGTTGRPKGAVLTYGNHWWSAVGSALHLGGYPADRWLACLPLFHVGGLAILVRSVIYGTAAVVHRRFDPDAVHRAIDEEGITLLSVVPTMLARLLQARAGRPYPPTLRAVLVGGGPAPADLLRRAAELGMPVAPTYGLTEAASQVTTLLPEQALRRPGSAGRPLPVSEVRVVRDGRPAAAGEVGEIQLRGPTVIPGYLHPDGTRPAQLPDGWLPTGDLGYLDAEGFLYVLDRRDDLIISGGENVYPAEVEQVLMAHPAVEEAGVVGVPDPEWGQVPVAAVRLRPGGYPAGGPAQAEAVPSSLEAGLEAELVAHCRRQLAGYKVPRRIVALPELPRNAAAKLMRHRLREILAAAHPGRPPGPA